MCTQPWPCSKGGTRCCPRGGSRAISCDTHQCQMHEKLCGTEAFNFAAQKERRNEIYLGKNLCCSVLVFLFSEFERTNSGISWLDGHIYIAVWKVHKFLCSAVCNLYEQSMFQNSHNISKFSRTDTIHKDIFSVFPDGANKYMNVSWLPEILSGKSANNWMTNWHLTVFYFHQQDKTQNQRWWMRHRKDITTHRTSKP